MDNIYDLFKPSTPELEARWIREALEALTRPQTLTERNWVQVMLAERHRSQFMTASLLESMKKISVAYGSQFPH